MKTKIGKGLVAVAVAAMVFSTVGVYAEASGNAPQRAEKREWHLKKMAKELQLTAEQQEQLAKEHEEFASKSKDLKAKMRSTRSSLKAELEKPAPDKDQVGNLTTELKNLSGQQIQNRVDKVMAMKQILTAEQFNKMKCSMEGRKHDKRPTHGKNDKHDDKDDSHGMI